MNDREEPAPFDIDAERLDQEWLEQSRLYHQAALRLADARRDHEQAKADRDVTCAELDRSVRSQPGKYGLEKVTEGAVANLILLQPEHKRATQKVIEAKHTADVFQADVDALDHRKRALENLVQLRLANYFSEPRVRGNPEETEKFRNRGAGDFGAKPKKRDAR